MAEYVPAREANAALLDERMRTMLLSLQESGIGETMICSPFAPLVVVMINVSA